MNEKREGGDSTRAKKEEDKKERKKRKVAYERSARNATQLRRWGPSSVISVSARSARVVRPGSTSLGRWGLRSIISDSQ